MWEDEAHKQGGRWSLKVDKGYANKIWEDLLLALIGEQFESANEITGVTLNIKPKFDSFQVWNRSGRDPQVIESIKNDLVRLLGLSSNIEMDYAEFYPENPPEQKKRGGQERAPRKYSD